MRLMHYEITTVIDSRSTKNPEYWPRDIILRCCKIRVNITSRSGNRAMLIGLIIRSKPCGNNFLNAYTFFKLFY